MILKQPADGQLNVFSRGTSSQYGDHKRLWAMRGRHETLEIANLHVHNLCLCLPSYATGLWSIARSFSQPHRYSLVRRA